MRVAGRVIHDLVPGIAERLYGFGVFVHPVADDKKGRVYAVFIQDVYQRLRVLIAPCSVKGQGNGLVVALDAVNGQLARC